MVIGSVAIKHWFPDFNREPKDIDIISYKEESLYKINQINPNNLRVEILENPILLNYCIDNNISIYCSPDILYTLKISHSLWYLENNSWDKHMWDIQFLKEHGCKFIPELFILLYEYWLQKHGIRKTSDLQMSSADFFNNAIDYPIEHDTLHEMLIKHEYFNQSKPTYTKILEDDKEVEVSEDKFNLLSEQEKHNIVTEEVMVMATERFSHLNYKVAFSKMLRKFILYHAPLWEAVWIIQNHKKLLTIPFNYIEFLKQ